MKRLRPANAASGPQAYWNAMRALTASKGGFTCADIAARFPGVVLNTIGSFIAACLRADAIKIAGAEPTDTSGPDRKRYAVNLNSREAPLEKPGIWNGTLGAKQRQLWNAIRALPSFTTRDLALLASTDDVEISEGTARAYVSALAKAGYLQPRPKGGRWPVWRLKRSKDGPLPPAVRKDGSVIERNVLPTRARRAA